MENEAESRLTLKIDAYLMGHLPKEEGDAFAQEMARDKGLAARVARQRLHLEALELMLEDDLRAKMKAWDGDSSGVSSHANRWKPFGVGLLALAIVTGLYFLFKPHDHAIVPPVQKPELPDTMRVERKEIPTIGIDSFEMKAHTKVAPPKKKPSKTEPPEIEPSKTVPSEKPIAETQMLPDGLLASANADLVVMVVELESEEANRGPNTDTPLVRSYRKMLSKEYSNALGILDTMKDEKGSFARGIAYFLDGHYMPALPIFETLAKSEGFDNPELAAYYGALCLWATGRKEEAVKRLGVMAGDPKHAFSSQAAAALKRI